MPMHYFIYAILLLFLFYVPTATSLTADDDDLFLTFVKGKPNFEKFCKELEENGKLENIRKLENDNMQSFTNFDQKKDFLIQMYEAHLGVVYLMRKNWKCAEIREEIKHEKKECEKLRKYLDILHEYLFRVHLEAAADQTLSQQLPAVKPQFEFYLGSEELPLKTLTQIVKGLIKILPFFFDQYTNSMYKYKLNEMLIKPPKFSNEWELNYELNANGNGGTLRKLAQKMKQKKNAIGTFREQFDKKLKRMLMNTKQNEAAEMGVLNILEGLKPRNYYKYERNYLRIKNSEHRDKFDIFLSSQFDGTIISSVDEDDIFLAFVKDQSNFGRFCQEKEEDLQYIDYGPTYGFTFDQKKKHLMQKYGAHLSVVHLMNKYWNCDNIVKKPELNQKEMIEDEKKECQKFRKYLDILYEYLFRVHLEAANQTLSKQLPAVKPQFVFYLHSEELPLKTLIQIVEGFSKISNFFFAKQTKLSTEGELNYKLKTANANAIRALLKEDESAIGTFREQFDKKLEQMLTNTKQNEAKEKAELESEKNKMISMRAEVEAEEADLIRELARKQARCPLYPVDKYNAFWEIFPNCLPLMDEKMKQANKQTANSDKFDIFLNSPFYDKV